MRNKCNILEDYISDKKIVPVDISFICVTEHWLCQDELVNSQPDGFYCAAHYCRTSHIRGGVGIFIANSLEARVLDVSSFSSELHFEVAAAFVDKLKIIVVCIYHSPASDHVKFLSSLETLLTYLSKWENYTIIAGGDLNADFDVTSTRATAGEFLNLLRQFNCYCLNSNPTRGNNCLDNVFVNCSREKVVCNVKDFPFSDHAALVVGLQTIDRSNRLEEQPISSVTHSSFKLVMPKQSICNLIEKLNLVNWCMLSPQYFCNSSTMFTCFFSILVNIFQYFQCLKPCRPTPRFRSANTKCVWYTQELAAIKEQLLSLDFLFKSTSSPIVKGQLLGLKKVYRNKILDAKVSYNSKLIDSSKNKCKTAWAIVKKTCNLSSENKPLVAPNVFNQFCVEVVEQTKRDIVPPLATAVELVKNVSSGLRPNGKLFEWKPVTNKDVLKAVEHLSNSSSNDYYYMSNNLLKQIIPSIVTPFVVCINSILLDGHFPDELKISRVCPVYKKGPKDKPESYRPVSLVPVLSKIIEIIVYNQVILFLEENEILYSSQFGFRRGRATQDAMDDLISQILQAFEARSYAQVTFCDLSKAFDCVDHSDLLSKLHFYGIQGVALQLFESYLKDRRQVVYIDGVQSQEVYLKYGVPQGSVLGPLLFLISINDLPPNVQCRTLLYADDTTFVNTSSNLLHLSNLVNNSIEEASSWFRANGYLLNKNKTENIVFSLRPYDHESLVIETAVSTKFLGVCVDQQLTWNTHIDCVTTRLSRVVFLLGRLKYCVTPEYIRMAYFAFFQSIIKYCLLVWGNCSRIEEVLILQKKAVRIIDGSADLEHCRPIFIKLRIFTVINLYILELVIYSLKKLPVMVLNEDVHPYNTRGRHQISYQHLRLSKSLNSHVVMCKKAYNKVVINVNKYPQKIFLKKFSDWLLRNPFYSIEEFLEQPVISL